jgi:ketosteroid isomerase-like protein
MADLWTEDAVRFGPDGPAHIGRPAIRAANERSTSSPLKVLSFVPETRDLRIWDGGAVEWRYFTASFVASPGAEPAHVRGTVLVLLKKLPDGSWKVFRAMGIMARAPVARDAIPTNRRRDSSLRRSHILVLLGFPSVPEWSEAGDSDRNRQRLSPRVTKTLSLASQPDSSLALAPLRAMITSPSADK